MSAEQVELRPFRVAVSDRELADLRDRLDDLPGARATRWRSGVRRL